MEILKDKTIKENRCGIVYQVECEDCDSKYIGETECSLWTRFMEHCRPSSTSSEVSKHLHQECPGDSTSLESAKILDAEPRYFERGVRESIQIRIHQPSLNWDSGRHKLAAVWTNILRAHLLGPGEHNISDPQWGDMFALCQPLSGDQAPRKEWKLQVSLSLNVVNKV